MVPELDRMADPLNRWIVHNVEVLYARPGVVAVTPDDIADLKERAAHSPRRRCRFCLHETPADDLHDMVIALGRGVYDRPHRHIAKVETLIALEGEGIFVRFAADGRPIAFQRFSAVGARNSAHVLRTPVGEYHGLLVESEWLVFCESTLGPFDPAAIEFAPWSPTPADAPAVERYLTELHCRAIAA
jgi:cupin fold WbuC family metalloprotein